MNRRLSFSRRRLDDRACASIPDAQCVVRHALTIVRRAAVFGRHDVVEKLLSGGHFRLRESAVRHSFFLSSVWSSPTMAEGAALSRRGPGSAVPA